MTLKPVIKIFILLLVVLSISLAGCSVTNPLPTPTATATQIPTKTPESTATITLTPEPSPTATLQLSGPYLGQQPPGMEPEIFAPGIVSDPNFTEYSGAFSPDGSEYYFYRFSEDSPSRLLFSQVVDGNWTAPVQLAFTAAYGASEPYVTPDNQRLYFLWENPASAAQAGFAAYYFADRTSTGWSEPVYAGAGMFLSASRDGQLYTTDISSITSRRTYLARVSTRDGFFTGYEKVSIQAHYGSQAHPCISPDGSYLLFDVQGGNYLYVSFKNADGTWGEAIDLTKHGFDSLAGGATISPDGKYLFFSLRGDIWWVDIGVIENLRPSG